VAVPIAKFWKLLSYHLKDAHSLNKFIKIKTNQTMKKTIILFALAGFTTIAFAQKKRVTTSATISFDATTPTDALPKAENKTVVASMNVKNGNVAFEALMKSFTFSNPKIQEHFNEERWLDSKKFPKATFKGKISNPAAVNLAKDGTYETEVTGILTLHGITKPVTTKATFVVTGKTVSTTAAFSITLADYGVKVDGSGGKIAPEAKLTVKADFK
jgi:polyisoprenoid-binding protein YceI